MARIFMPSGSGTAGAAGPQGPPGPGASFSGLSGEALPDRSLVYLRADGQLYKADSSLVNTADKLVGFVQGAVGGAGLPVTVVKDGELNGFAGLTAAQVYYMGTNGGITMVAPSSGLVQSVGVASAPNKLVIELSPAVELV